MPRLLALGGLLIALPIVLANVWLYDRWLGLPGTSTIPRTWWELALMLVIPGILLGYWLLERYYDWRYGDKRR